MLKRKVLFVKKILKFKIWNKSILDRLLLRSFCENHFLIPKNRISFFIKTEKRNYDHFYYKSQNRLHCYLTYSMRVPNSKVHLSRYYLNKGVDRLWLTHYQK